MLEIRNASDSTTDTTTKRVGDTYTALPPKGWDCAPSHEEIIDEEVQPGDEDFKVCYDNGALMVIFDGTSYQGHLSSNHNTGITVGEAWLGLANCGLVVTNILRTNMPGEYSLRFRELTEVEKEVFREYSL